MGFLEYIIKAYSYYGDNDFNVFGVDNQSISLL